MIRFVFPSFVVCAVLIRSVIWNIYLLFWQNVALGIGLRDFLNVIDWEPTLIKLENFLFSMSTFSSLFFYLGKGWLTWTNEEQKKYFHNDISNKNKEKKSTKRDKWNEKKEENTDSEFHVWHCANVLAQIIWLAIEWACTSRTILILNLVTTNKFLTY